MRGAPSGPRRLAVRVGSAAARDLVGSGRRIDAEEAVSLGLIQRVVAPEAVDAALLTAADLCTLDPETTARVQALTVADTRESDLANLVESAARPGLKSRIAAYVAALQARKSEGEKR